MRHIRIEAHPGATGATLARFDDSWSLTFKGDSDFTWQLQVITTQQFDEVLLAGYSDHEVVEYVERCMRAAGYTVQRVVPEMPEDAAEWAFRFFG